MQFFLKVLVKTSKKSMSYSIVAGLYYWFT